MTSQGCEFRPVVACGKRWLLASNSTYSTASPLIGPQWSREQPGGTGGCAGEFSRDAAEFSSSVSTLVHGGWQASVMASQLSKPDERDIVRHAPVRHPQCVGHAAGLDDSGLGALPVCHGSADCVVIREWYRLIGATTVRRMVWLWGHVKQM
jgi:hypothetical protein